MSADNWAFCPKCKIKNEELNKKRVLDVAKKYGKIPADEYVELAKEAAIPITLEQTLREDYELGIKDGLFSVNYSASCNVCKFSFEFETTKEVLNEK